ncbi:MAG TPA: NAD(P)-dependent oxidoreductase [Planctomycetota bacterium]|nr:NAD(P)-dependent oxidoreductase [Planctomycetota bacterium]
MQRGIIILPLLAVALGAGAALLREVPATRPNEVVELARGVYFRHGDLDAHGHCNNGFVIFEEFVLVIDGNFPGGAEACLADIRKVTDKPVRFAFNTHHHGDHAYGNPVWVKAGAVPVAHEGVVREMARLEPGRWRESMGREDIKATGLDSPIPPRLTFPDRMVIDDGTMRVELLHFGTAHTRGDGFAYLPAEKILFTGDAVVNGPYNFMGDGNTESWLEVIDALRRLDVEIIAPGHGPAGTRNLLDEQHEYIASLRTAIAAALAAGKTPAEITASIEIPERVKRYVGSMYAQQVSKVRSEMLGLEMPLELERLGFEAGPPVKKEEWKQPRKIVFSGDPAMIPALEQAAAGVKIVAAAGEEAAIREVADADAILGRISRGIVEAGKGLRWVHSFSAGVEQYVGTGDDRAPGIDALIRSGIVLTNGRRCYGPNIADQVFAYLLGFTRQLKSSIEGKALVPAEGDGSGGSPRGASRWKSIDPGDKEEIELRGKRMVILGLGGIGSEVALRARAFGMHVVGVDPAAAIPFAGVDEIHRPAALLTALAGAHVLVVACPLTKETKGLVGARQLALLAPGAYFINVARGRIVDHDALVEAVRSGKLAGVGLDVTDPEPLPDGSPLWSLPNVVITPHNAGQSDGSRRRIRLLARENIRRFVSGEPLLNVVDKTEGY